VSNHDAVFSPSKLKEIRARTFWFPVRLRVRSSWQPCSPTVLRYSCSFGTQKLKHGDCCWSANCLTSIADWYDYDVSLPVTLFLVCWKSTTILVILYGDSSEIKSLVKWSVHLNRSPPCLMVLGWRGTVFGYQRLWLLYQKLWSCCMISDLCLLQLVEPCKSNAYHQAIRKFLFSKFPPSYSVSHYHTNSDSAQFKVQLSIGLHTMDQWLRIIFITPTFVPFLKWQRYKIAWY